MPPKPTNRRDSREGQMTPKTPARTQRENGCEACAIDQAMAANDREALERFIVEGKIHVLGPELIEGFRESLSGEERRDYEAINVAEGMAAALGFILKQRLKDACPSLRINYPGRRLQ